MTRILSLDIDGTMVFGDPPGPIAVEAARAAQVQGWIIGSASDRGRSDQQRLWDAHELVVDFVANKHRLGEVWERYAPGRALHIGDTEIDEHFARLAGFDFHHVDDFPEAGLAVWLG